MSSIDRRPRVWSVEAPVGNAYMVRGLYGSKTLARSKARKLRKDGFAVVVVGYLIDRDETEKGWLYADDENISGISGRYVYEDRHLTLNAERSLKEAGFEVE